MSIPIVTNTEVTKEAVQSLDTFRHQVATYYANILYGLHLRREPMIYVFPYTLAGLSFDSPQLQPHLRTLLATKLALKNNADLQFTYTRILRETNKTCTDGEVELYLRIEVCVSIH